MWPSWLPLRADLAPLTPYGAPQIPSDASLNTNENPFPLSPMLAQAITDSVARIASTLNRYPDRDVNELRAELATYINERAVTEFSAKNIWAANGSNEIIQSIFLAFGEGTALGFTPSYSMHPLIAKVVRTSWVDGTRNADFSFNVEVAINEVKKHRPTMVFITTPNNPTGGAIAFNEIERLADVISLHGGLLIVDEAYAEFSSEKSAVRLIEKNPHVIVIRTMSKAFAFAGARVGYLIADPVVVHAMALVRLPYHLSALTQAAALVAIKFRKELLGNVASLIAARESLVLSLRAIGLTTVPSEANFILFTGFQKSAPQLWQELLEKGVLVRDVGLSGHLRVTIGNEAENRAFLKALTELL